MRILIISGFLGAGKTTFIKELIRRTGGNVVVMENEFGSASLDSSAVSSGGIDVLEFMEGCVCCTMKDSFVNSVLTVSASLDPEYLVIEPTGAAELGSLMNSLRKICYDKITLAAPVTVVSPAGFFGNMNSCGGIFTDQIKNAAVIVLTKTDLCDESEISLAIDAIREINPSAEIVSQPYSCQPDDWWNGLFQTWQQSAPTKVTVRPRPTELEEYTLKGRGFRSPAELIELLRGMLWGHYGVIIRTKGVVKCGGEMLRFDLADGIYSITGECALDEQQCVFIGKNLNKEKIIMGFEGYGVIQ